MYFADEELNEVDRLLLAVPEEERDKLVVSLGEGRPEDDPGAQRGTFNIILQRVARG